MLSRLKWDQTKTWCWISNTNSFKNNVVSFLACVETVVACSLTISAGIYFDHWYHLVFWVLLSPFLLLRSNHSVEISFSWIRKLEKYSYKELSGRHFIGLLIVVKSFFIVFFIRIGSIIVSLLKYRFKILNNVPKNWKLYSFCMDNFHPLEVLPGIEYKFQQNPNDIHLSRIRFDRLYSRLLSKKRYLSFFRKSTRFITYLIIFSLLFLPSLFYRWSIKSTTIIYLPFIYLSKDTYHNEPLQSRATKILNEKLKLYWAVFGIIICFTILPIFFATFTNLYSKLYQDNYFLSELFNFFTCTPKIERWNVARLLCAIITVVMFIIAKMSVSILLNNQLWQNKTSAKFVDSFLKSLNILRALGVYYVIFCGILIIWNKAQEFGWLFSIDWVIPKIGENWFPTING